MQQSTPPPDPNAVQYIVAALAAVMASLITLVGVLFTQSKQAGMTKETLEKQGEQKDKELSLQKEKQEQEFALQKEKQERDSDDAYYKNLVDIAEKVQGILTTGYERRIKTVEDQLASSDLRFIEYQNKVVQSQERSDDLINKLEQEKSDSRKKISRLEKRLIEGYNVIMKLLALLKEKSIPIPADLQKEIEDLRPSDTQQLEK